MSTLERAEIHSAYFSVQIGQTRYRAMWIGHFCNADQMVEYTHPVTKKPQTHDCSLGWQKWEADATPENALAYVKMRLAEIEANENLDTALDEFKETANRG